MYTTALFFAEQTGVSAQQLQRGDRNQERVRTILEIFENLDADNFDAVQLMSADISIFRPGELYRRLEHEHRW